MKTYDGSSNRLSKRLGRVGAILGKVFRGCGSFSLVIPETTKDAFLCVVGDREGSNVCGFVYYNNLSMYGTGIKNTATGGGRNEGTRQKGNIPFRALLKKNFPLCLA